MIVILYRITKLRGAIDAGRQCGETPVQLLGLGFLGFDHLQIVFRNGPEIEQEHWFVIEGVRDADEAGVWLGVQGWDGGTTLSDANGGLVGEDLLRRVGSSAGRGAQEIADGGEAIALWGRLVSHANDIAAQHFPYIPIALPNSALPTINSSSLVASLLHHAGVGLADVLPSGLRFRRAWARCSARRATTRWKPLRALTTLAGGGGDDVLTGGETTGTVDKLYGGVGNDTLRWSRGTNILHGGQPGIAYADDGIDTVDYSGAGAIRIDALPAGEPHGQADFVVRHAGGRDYLFSIEEILWDVVHDRVTLGDGVGLSARQTGAGPEGTLPEARAGEIGRPRLPGFRCPRYAVAGCVARAHRDAFPRPWRWWIGDRLRTACPARVFGVALLSGLMATASMASDSCAPEAGSTHGVIQVIDGETLVLDDGQEVRLIGALAPKPDALSADTHDWPPTRDAARALGR